jgi:hypothetical protein
MTFPANLVLSAPAEGVSGIAEKSLDKIFHLR